MVVLIYGASGYTGRLLLERALSRGHRPILAGRDGPSLRRLAERCGCEWREAPVEIGGALDEALRGVDVLINGAGPFAATAIPLADACLRSGTHYLDVSGEIEVFQRLHARDTAARERGVMLMPGVGFVVAATDCLGLHTARRLQHPRSLVFAVSRPTLWSRGSLRTMIDQWGDTVEVLRDGALHRVPTGALGRHFDFGAGCRFATALRWPDVVTAPLTTGIRNVEVYGEVDVVDWWSIEWRRTCAPLLDALGWRGAMKQAANLLSEGPSAGVRAAHDRVVVVEARDDRGGCARSRMRTPEPYTFTQHVALEVTERVLRGEYEPGFRTPAGTYGAGLVIGPDRLVPEDFPI